MQHLKPPKSERLPGVKLFAFSLSNNNNSSFVWTEILLGGRISNLQSAVLLQPITLKDWSTLLGKIIKSYLKDGLQGEKKKYIVTNLYTVVFNGIRGGLSLSSGPTSLVFFRGHFFSLFP